MRDAYLCTVKGIEKSAVRIDLLDIKAQDYDSGLYSLQIKNGDEEFCRIKKGEFRVINGTVGSAFDLSLYASVDISDELVMSDYGAVYKLAFTELKAGLDKSETRCLNLVCTGNVVVYQWHSGLLKAGRFLKKQLDSFDAFRGKRIPKI